MALGFVLINVETGKEREVYEKLMETEEVREVYPLFGEHDLVTKVEANGFEELSEIVVEKVRGLEGVSETKTLTGAKF